MRKVGVAMAAGMGALALAGCSHKNTAGVMGHGGGPDEFAVASRAPLVIPPDYALVPPKPGEPRPQEADSSTQALQALFGGEAQHSTSEAEVVDQAETTQATPGIRSEVGSATTTVVDKGQTTRDILSAPAGNGPDAAVSTGPANPPVTSPSAAPPTQNVPQ